MSHGDHTINPCPPPVHDRCMPNALRCLIAICVLISNTSGSEPEHAAAINSFLKAHCYDCHSGADADGGLDLQQLSADLSDTKTMARLVRIFDRVHDGEMPPEDAGELDPDEAAGFLDATSDWLTETQQQEYAQLGRVRSRRLTNQQLERTLQDLLAIDVPLASLMPEEQRTDGFTNIAEGQPMSHFQLESHLHVVDTALDAAFKRLSKDDDWSKDFTARQLARENPNQRCRDPEMIDGKAVIWNGSVTFYGRITSTTIPEDGWYRITLTASALNSPEDHGVWCTVRSGECTSGAPLLFWIGSFEATDDPTERTFEAWIQKGHMLEIRPGDQTLKVAKFEGGQVGAGEGGPQEVPGVAFHSMRIEQFHPCGDVDLVRKRLFGDLKVTPNKQGQLKLDDQEPDKALTKQLRAFMRRAFRRPVTDSQEQPYVQMLNDRLQSGEDPIDALRACYRAVLCSPRFLYLVEPIGPLDDDAIASRLSYLLTGSMPDYQLTKQVQAGTLRDPTVLGQEVDRLLKGKRGLQFVKDFSGQWLDLDDIDFTEPDRKLHPDFDLVVQNAMLNETHLFVQSLIADDASASMLVDANYTYLNSRLARYYGISAVASEECERVDLPADSPRGGLLAQGAILKVTANGTNTSPVLRGVWVSERILGTPIPPPPESVPAVEPDIRGAKTIREQLEKHLANSQCAVCHRNIDPPGYALENFDAAGGWRDSYLKMNERRPAKGAKIDPSFTLADGRCFEDFDEFRKLMAENPRPLARNFAEKLLVYGTGAPISFADRQVVEKIVDQTADTNLGLRSLLHAVVTSPIFLNK
jgi:Protein of unknown function (DUF1592)/Protein of unknown function (DUF1588)/Protein of unknown function (DUF1595)/Protein of unknown function (DUF1585)/Protein of unknown function (DUF1587)/Planctomycete cytochrome C